MQRRSPAEDDEERRPLSILVIYSWDMLLALFALLGALAAFGGQAMVGSRTVDVTLAEQILAAVESASFAALLIILATLLTRRGRWIRRAQITTLALAIGLGAIGLLVAVAVPGQGLELPRALTSVLVLLVDAIAITALTGERVVAWYNVTAQTPRYISATIAFWAASSVVLVILQALR